MMRKDIASMPDNIDTNQNKKEEKTLILAFIIGFIIAISIIGIILYNVTKTQSVVANNEYYN